MQVSGVLAAVAVPVVLFGAAYALGRGTSGDAEPVNSGGAAVEAGATPVALPGEPDSLELPGLRTVRVNYPPLRTPTPTPTATAAPTAAPTVGNGNGNGNNGNGNGNNQSTPDTVEEVIG